VGITKFVGAKGMGLLMEREVKFLGQLLGDVERPFVAIVGGAKVSDKIGVLENLLGRVNQLLIGGAMANTFLKAKGGHMGRSLVEADKLPLARAFLRKAEEAGVDVLLPRDAVAGAGIKADTGRVVQAMEIPEELAALDIGPETARGFADAVTRARTILWNGPMGVFESAPFADGTFAIARAVASAKGALSVVGGGDSVAAVQKSGVADKITHISTGGGASLEFLEGKTLPGLAALETAS
jgi:phosphoglycerate kinase